MRAGKKHLFMKHLLKFSSVYSYLLSLIGAVVAVVISTMCDNLITSIIGVIIGGAIGMGGVFLSIYAQKDKDKMIEKKIEDNKLKWETY